MHTVLNHPLVKHRVTLMRDINTKPIFSASLSCLRE